MELILTLDTTKILTEIYLYAYGRQMQRLPKFTQYKIMNLYLADWKKNPNITLQGWLEKNHEELFDEEEIKIPSSH